MGNAMCHALLMTVYGSGCDLSRNQATDIAKSFIMFLPSQPVSLK